MAEARFKDFDWEASEAWKEHCRNLFPTPTLLQLQKIKRKWFIQHVDSTLSLDPPESSAAHTHSHESPHSHEHSHPHTHSRLLLIPGFLFALWPLALAVGQGMQLALVAHLSGVVCKYGRPRATKDYWRVALVDDDLHSSVFCVFFVFYSQRLVGHLPVALSALIWASTALSVGEIPAAIRDRALAVNKLQIALYKGHLQVALGCYLVAATLAQRCSLIEMILYWQLLRVQYGISIILQATFVQWREAISPRVQRIPILNSIWSRLTRFFQYMVSTERKQGQCAVM